MESELKVVVKGCQYLSKRYSMSFNDKDLEKCKKEMASGFYLKVLQNMYLDCQEEDDFVSILVKKGIISENSWLVKNLNFLISQIGLFNVKVHENLVDMLLKQLYRMNCDQFVEGILSTLPEFNPDETFPFHLQEAFSLFFSIMLGTTIVNMDISKEKAIKAIEKYTKTELKSAHLNSFCSTSRIDKTIFCIELTEIFEPLIEQELDFKSDLESSFQSLSKLPIIDIPKEIEVNFIPSRIPTLVSKLPPIEKKQDSRFSVEEPNMTALEILQDCFDTTVHKNTLPLLNNYPVMQSKSPAIDFDNMLQDLDTELATLTSNYVFIDLDGSQKDLAIYKVEKSQRRERLLEKLKKATTVQKSKPKRPLITRSNSSKLSTKNLMKNAIIMLLGGSLAEETRKQALKALEDATCDYFIISLKDSKNHGYKSLYSVSTSDVLVKVHGIGPQTIKSSQVTNYYKFDCGSKNFKDISQTSSNEFHASVHAIVMDRK